MARGTTAEKPPMITLPAYHEPFVGVAEKS